MNRTSTCTQLHFNTSCTLCMLPNLRFPKLKTVSIFTEISMKNIQWRKWLEDSFFHTIERWAGSALLTFTFTSHFAFLSLSSALYCTALLCCGALYCAMQCNGWWWWWWWFKWLFAIPINLLALGVSLSCHNHSPYQDETPIYRFRHLGSLHSCRVCIRCD